MATSPANCGRLRGACSRRRRRSPISRLRVEHDPEKACPALDAGWAPVFPRDKREAFARRSCSIKKIERDDDSKKSHPALCGLGDQLHRRDHDVAAGDLPGLFGIVLEKIPRLQGLDGLLVGGRGKMIIAGIVAVLHAAVDDLSLQLGIVVERGNEPADLPMPFLRGAVGKLIFDHEMFHRLLLSGYFRKSMPSDLIRGGYRLCDQSMRKSQRWTH